MKTPLKIIAIIFVGSLFASAANAFFPFPVPLFGVDLGNNAADIGENLNAIGEKAEQAQATIQKTVEEVKSGSFGFNAIKSYTETLQKINLSRAIPKIQLPSGLSKNVNDGDQTSAAVENVYLNTYSEEGNHMEQAKKNRQKQTELLQMNVAAMYAHALATRVNLAKQRDLPETTLDSKDTREILQSNRAMSEQILKRWNDILFMEAQIVEYEATQMLTKITLDSETAAERKEASSQGENK